MISHSRALLLAIGVVAGLSFVGGGCSPSDEEDDGEPAVDCNACNAGIPITGSGQVSFKEHLFKDDNEPGIFRRACNLASCHGINPGSKAGLYLGPPRGPVSGCGTDTTAGPCTPGGSDCGTGDDDACIDPPLGCTCGSQHCSTPSQRCIANPTDGTPMCGPPSDAGVCATNADCNAGAAGECVNPDPSCTCGDATCAPGQRCVPSPADANAALRTSIINSLVNKQSKTFPTIPLVTPGDPKNSFLMMKIDGCQSCLDVENCATGETGNCCSVQSGALPGKAKCGDRMPRGSDVLSAAERDVVRRWIQQGAQDN